MEVQVKGAKTNEAIILALEAKLKKAVTEIVSRLRKK